MVTRRRLPLVLALAACPAPGGPADTTQSSGPATSTGDATTGAEPTTDAPTTSATSGATTGASTVDATSSGSSSTTDATSSTSTTGPEMTSGEPAPDFTPLALEVADFNGDGAADLLILGVDEIKTVAGAISLGLGDGTFAPAIDPMLGGSSAFPAIGLLDGAPGVDVLMADGGNQASVWRWGLAWFTQWKVLTSVELPLVHVVKDTNMDGRDDVVVLWRSLDTIGLVLIRGSDGAVWPRKITTLGQAGDLPLAPTSLLVGHFDGDGFADALLFQADTAGGFLRCPGAADGAFGAPIQLAPELRPWTGALGDFDEDGALDVLIAEHGPARLVLARGDGKGGLTPATTVDIAGFVPLALTLADLDGDGHLDVIAVDDQTPELRIWPGHGDGTFSEAQVIGLPSGAVRAHAAHLNDDTSLDLVVATFAAGAPTILLGP